ANSFDEIFVDFRQETPEQGGGVRYHIFLHPKQDVTVRRLELRFEIPTQPDDRFFANGYQSWSESRLLRVTDQLPPLRRVARNTMGYSGDEYITNIPRGKGHLHAWTYTYFQRASGKSSLFCGSLHEKTGFTLLLYDQRNSLLTVRKDLSDLRLSHSFPALDIWMDEGEETDLFDRYFQAMALPPPTAPPALGWTSGYRHFTNISAEILSKDLDSLTDTPITTAASPAYFQIDDGWQTAVGDWLSIQPGFSGGMTRMAADIRAKGLLPGLWLAPFVAAKDADLVKRHPDWLLKDARGRPLRVGRNPQWGGWYYALDFYNGAVRDYLSGVFHLVLEKWGYELVKLDFLFAVCLAPPPGKTRGAVMYEAMEFLRQQVGTRRILASGVPLGSCFGLVDYCRIGGGIHLAWEHRLLAFLHHRERVSTLAGLHSTLGRWVLNGRAFHNDSGVFILREKEQKLTLPQQQTLLIINVLLGNLLFTSDDLSQYSPEQTAELEGALMWRGSRILAVREPETEVYAIYFEQEKEHYTAYCNLNGKVVALAPPSPPLKGGGSPGGKGEGFAAAVTQSPPVTGRLRGA
ncbi:MAG: alpha-galactosidase, partial [Saprospiraceae bacterium]|nr:alpha-galactosidase [Saprospiraceae bacterium]